jgi:uncharacterized protein (TIGR02266 family)
VRFVVDGDVTAYTGTMRNLSDHGILVRTFNLPAIGQRVRLRFRVPFVDELVDVESKVLWTRTEEDADDPVDAGFGARFVPGTRRQPILVLAPDKPSEERPALSNDYGTPLRYLIEGSARFFTGFARDVSRGGIFIHTYDPPEVGTRLEVTFLVPILDTIIQLPAEVAWVRPEDRAPRAELVGFGARFLQVPPEVARAINHRLDHADDTDFFT